MRFYYKMLWTKEQYSQFKNWVETSEICKKWKKKFSDFSSKMEVCENPKQPQYYCVCYFFGETERWLNKYCDLEFKGAAGKIKH